MTVSFLFIKANERQIKILKKNTINKKTHFTQE